MKIINMITNQVQSQFSKLLLVVLTTSTVVATGRGAQKIVQTIKTSSKISVPQVKQYQSTSGQSSNTQVQGSVVSSNSATVTPSLSPSPTVNSKPKVTTTPEPTHKLDDSMYEHSTMHQEKKENSMDGYYEEVKSGENKYESTENHKEEEKKLKEYFDKERKEYFEREHKEDRD